MLKINRTCKTFNIIIKSVSRLWRNIDIDHAVQLKKQDLETILKHSGSVYQFLLPYASYLCSVPEIDYVFTKYFEGHKLWYLNLSAAPLSTLCFLSDAPNLELVQLCECKLLTSEDFLVLKDCAKLSQLWLSFTNISQEHLKIVTYNKPLIVVDVCGVLLDIKGCEDILTNTIGHIVYFHVSLKPEISEEEFKQHILDKYLETSIKVHNE